MAVDDDAFDPMTTDPLDAVMAQEKTLATAAKEADPTAAVGDNGGNPPAKEETGKEAAAAPQKGFSVAPPDADRDEQGSDGKSPEGKDAGGEAKKEGEAGAPPVYEVFSFPEGVVENPELMKEFTAAATEMRLTQEQAQAFVTMQGKAELARQEAQKQFIAKSRDEFRKELEADPEVGGAFKERTLERANLALRTFDTGGKLGALLSEWNIDEHPEIVRFLEAAGASLEEDFSPGGKSGGGEMSTAQVLFPGLK